ncbi:MAG: cadherin-like domain-containing protein [Saprospiraceae bacterium]|nr:cadherin-like domain-containing protein [Saprospiraceae bacterium]
MNVLLLQPRFRVLLFPLLIAFGTPRFVSAQSGAFKNLTTSVNKEVSDTISGTSLFVYKASPTAKHGKMQIHLLQSGGAGNPHIYRIGYQPGPGFIGVDTFVVQLSYLNSWPFLVYQAYRVVVYPSDLFPQPDYAVTAIGTPVTINVLANDVGNGPLTVTAIPLINNGTVSVGNNNNLVFTPAAGFTGVAHLNYVVCDSLNHCKTTHASIGVHGNAPPNSDTLQLATTKNTRLTIPLLHDGYELFQAPANGTVSVDGGLSFRYIPNANFVGTDQFVLANNNFGTVVYKTVTVNVLNTPHQNKMAMDDRVFTPKGRPITFNVRQNDIGNLLVKSWVVPQGFPGTLSNTLGNGNVTFTPNPDFVGTATFQYRIGNQQIANLETATVSVVVGNMNPAYSEFELTTPAETPFVFNYRIPFNDFEFSVLNAPAHGVCDFYPGYSTHTLNGQTVSGHNLLIYTPDPGFVGTDEFEVNYCVSANGECQSFIVRMNVADILSADAPYCINECVWLGDVNNDGIVNNKDVLPLGHYMGWDGAQRPNAAFEWYGQFAPNWNNPFSGNAVDMKHADTDGNGVVNHLDTAALNLFYGSLSNLFPHIPPTSKSLPFSLKLLTPNPQIGDLVQVEVSLGSDSSPLTDLYGFTFDISLSPNIVDSAFKMTYFENSWLNLNTPSLWLDNNPRQGRLETAFTRTGGTPTSGKGIIGQFDFIIIDIIDGARPGKQNEQPSFTITIENPMLFSGSGGMLSGENQVVEIPIWTTMKGRAQDEKASDGGEGFLVYPSPANDRLRIRLDGHDFIEALAIFDVAGRQVHNAQKVQQSYTEINVSHLSPGFYVVSAQTSVGVLTKKFQIVR